VRSGARYAERIRYVRHACDLKVSIVWQETHFRKAADSEVAQYTLEITTLSIVVYAYILVLVQCGRTEHGTLHTRLGTEPFSAVALALPPGVSYDILRCPL
jgi:hypothetical protein